MSSRLMLRRSGARFSMVSRMERKPLMAEAAMPVQAGINTKLAGLVEGSIPAAFVSFLVGTLALGLVLAAMTTRPSRRREKSATTPA